MKRIFLLVLSSLFYMNLVGCDTVPTNALKAPKENKDVTKKDLITIAGIVEDEKNTPVVDVTIVVKEDKKEIGRTKTDEKGRFSIEVPKNFGDSYFVEASKNLEDGQLSQTLLISSSDKADFTGDNKLRKTVLAAKPVPIK